MTDRSEVYAAIDGERKYQQERGSQEDWLPNEDKTIGDFMIFMQEYLGIGMRDYSHMAHVHGGREAALNNIRKVAALAVACMETHGVVTREEEETEK